MRLKDIKKILNYDTTKVAVERKARLKKKKPTVLDNWEFVAEPKKSNYGWYLLGFSILFFIGSMLVAGFFYFAGIDNTVSSKKISIVVDGLSVVDSGSKTRININLTNHNPVSLKDVKLSILYPRGFYSSGDNTKLLIKDIVEIQEIKSGETTQKFIDPIIFGIEGERKNLKILVEYRTEGVNSFFQTEKEHTITLKSASVVMSTPIYTSPVLGKEITFSFNIKPSGNDPIKDLFIRLKYPNNFLPTGFSEKPVNSEQNIFYIQNLNNEKTIRVSGIIRGQQNSEQSLISEVFYSPTQNTEEAVLLDKKVAEFEVGSPFIRATIQLNNREENLIVSPGQTISGNIIWENIDNDVLSDVSLVVTIKGSGIDFPK